MSHRFVLVYRDASDAIMRRTLSETEYSSPVPVTKIYGMSAQSDVYSVIVFNPSPLGRLVDGEILTSLFDVFVVPPELFGVSDSCRNAMRRGGRSEYARPQTFADGR